MRTSLLMGLLLLLGSFAAGLFVGRRLAVKPALNLSEEGFVKETLYTLGGTVETLSDTGLVLKRNQKTLAVLVDGGTKLNLLTKVRPVAAEATAGARWVQNPEVTRNVRLQDLRGGDRVTIKAVFIKGKFVAKTISATR